MNQNNFAVTFILALLVSLVAQEHVGAQVLQPRPIDNGSQWAVYTDPRLDFTIEYPADWEVRPRTDDPAMVSEQLVFVSPVEDDNGGQYQIVVGQYMSEIGREDSLSSWTDRYLALFTSEDIRISLLRYLDIARPDAIYVRGASPLTEFQFTNIRRGRLVWFVWANFGDSATSQCFSIYDHMVSALAFGTKAPNTLQEMYGAGFQSASPSALVLHNNTDRIAHPPTAISFVEPTTMTPAIANSWWSPVLKQNGNMISVTCGSAFHISGETYAADVAAPYGYSVYAAMGGTVEIAGWDPSGFGNLVKLSSTNDYRHYYAHLSGIAGTVYVGKWVSQTEYVGTVGNSGGVPTHLHFHVQIGNYVNSSTPVTLIGMTGFADNLNDPYYPSHDGITHTNCAYIGR